jgi:hypothetical protein
MIRLFLIMAVCVAVILTPVGCSKPPTPTPDDISDVVITLERGPCFGACPVYKLTVYGDGRVVYEGIRFVGVEGTRTASISEEKVRQLVNEFQKIGYFSLDDEYIDTDATDLPSAITSITIAGKAKTVAHYHGDFSAPEELTALEDKIDEIASTEQWVERKS